MNRRPYLGSVQAAALALLVIASPGALASDASAKEAKNEAAADVGAQKKLSVRAVELMEKQMAEPPNRRIPAALRSQAKCVAIFPQVFKAGLLIAAQAGQGLVSCRSKNTAKWMTPAYFDINSASIGLQAGIQSASFILLFLTEESVKSLTDPKLTMDAGMDIAAGPVGAIARIENQPAVISYARTKGLFAGLDLSGSRLAYNKLVTGNAYGSEVDVQTALTSNRPAPTEELQLFMKTLARFAPAG